MIYLVNDSPQHSVNNKWLLSFILPVVLLFVCSDSYGKTNIPFQDTIHVTRISGKVSNLEDGTPLAGASVENLRTRRGTITNASGVFSIEVQTGDSIHFSFVGKVAQ